MRPDECRYREKPKGKSKPIKRSPPEDPFSSDSSSSSSSSRPTTPTSQVSPPPVQLKLQAEHPDGQLDLNPLLSWPDLSSICDPLYRSCSPNDPPGGIFVMPSIETGYFSSPVQSEERPSDTFTTWQYGLSIIAAKREAISAGDSSELIVAPLLVSVCELMGYLVKSNSPPEAWVPFGLPAATEAELERLVCSKLESPSGRGMEPLLRLQVCTLLSLYFAQKEDMRIAQEFLGTASNIVVQHSVALGLEHPLADVWSPTFDISYLAPHGVSDEARAAFSQMIYLDIQYGLIFKLPSTTLHWADTEINFVRAKSILSLHDSRHVAAAWKRWDFEQPTPVAWTKRYWSLIEEIYSHVNFLNTAVMDVSCIPVLQGALPTLNTCLITSLAALAELYGLFALSQPESRQKHREVVSEIANITQRFSENDYQHLDPILSICWSIAWRTLPETLEWSMPGSDSTQDDNVFRSGLLFLHAECSRKLRRANHFAV
ncbi:hypothetical protein R3P38DRAFT_3504461 [Favolaschia claudopus]|uniref:Transcription factor domain-containing protein n=1 Tax=Favolaschia claudopus TaxID=2862362 RepID=A0AAW0C4L4_9AGAR